jgi:hypothetical protein
MQARRFPDRIQMTRRGEKQQIGLEHSVRRKKRGLSVVGLKWSKSPFK